MMDMSTLTSYTQYMLFTKEVISAHVSIDLLLVAFKFGSVGFLLDRATVLPAVDLD
jgi:hypothetical protein